MKVYILSVESESGDDFGPFVFTEDEKPKTDDDLLKFLRDEASPCDCDPNEGDGPGFMGTYLHISWREQMIGHSVYTWQGSSGG